MGSVLICVVCRWIDCMQEQCVIVCKGARLYDMLVRGLICYVRAWGAMLCWGDGCYAVLGGRLLCCVRGAGALWWECDYNDEAFGALELRRDIERATLVTCLTVFHTDRTRL